MKEISLTVLQNMAEALEKGTVEKYSDNFFCGNNIVLCILDKAFHLLWERLGMNIEVASWEDSREDYLDAFVSGEVGALVYDGYLKEEQGWNRVQLPFTLDAAQVALLCDKDKVTEKELSEMVENTDLSVLLPKLFYMTDTEELWYHQIVSLEPTLQETLVHLLSLDDAGIYTDGMLYFSPLWHEMFLRYREGRLTATEEFQVKWLIDHRNYTQDAWFSDSFVSVESGVFLYTHKEGNGVPYDVPEVVLSPQLIVYLVYGDRLAKKIKEVYG